MKKIFILFLVMVMAVSFVGCSKGTDVDTIASVDNQIKDGTYQGKGKGKGGEISLELTIKDDVITEIKVLEQNETPGYDNAMETLIEDIIATNSIDVDVVSGCTFTSNGFKEAIEDALSNANATAAMLKKIDVAESSEEKKDVEEDYDVVIVGAGGAGLSAAIEAKMAGANVLVLEKMPMAGGNTLLSGGEYAAPNNWLQEKEGIEDSVDIFIEDMLKGGDNVGNPELVRVVAENALDGAEWLRDVVGVTWEEDLMFFGGHSIKRSLIPLEASGKEIITKQLAKAESLDIPILLNTRATSLIVDSEGKVIGVNAESDDTNYTFNTNKSVIIASGGFGSNLEMRVKYNPEIDETILSTNSTGSTGDGITMVEEIGGDLVGMEHIQTYPVCDPIEGTLLYFGDSRLYGHAILVNKEGKRFVEELERRDVISMAIKDQTGHVAYQLIDQRGFEESKLEANHKDEMDYLLENELLVKADSLEEVANFYEIDVAELQETVNRYNEYVEVGKDEEFNKRLMTNKIEEGPYYLMKAAPAVHHTMGGIKINTQAQVLDKDNNIIEGLYAAGEVTGGIHGTNRLGSDAIADITVFGRIAGKNAAK